MYIYNEGFALRDSSHIKGYIFVPLPELDCTVVVARSNGLALAITHRIDFHTSCEKAMAHNSVGPRLISLIRWPVETAAKARKRKN